VPTIGWDIGGVNTKLAHVHGGSVLSVLGRPYEIQRDPGALVPLLQEMRARIGAGDGMPHAVTMTAELSQCFRTKREGVRFVLDAVESAFPGAAIHVYAVDGRFLKPDDARAQPLSVAAANWADIGTTTTDLVPIAGGEIAAIGHTDPERLASGELLYTGVLRTPTEAIAHYVPLGDALAGVSAEGFALAGDVHVWRGDLDSADYSCPTPDGRPATREFAGERLARVVCADRDMLDETAITRLADALARAQIRTIQAAIQRVIEAHPSIRVAVVTGLGTFLGVAAARAAKLEVVPLSSELGDAGARCAPAVAVALLLERHSRMP